MLSTDLHQNHVGVGTRLVGVVQGYRPQVDWGGDSGSATIVVGGHNVRVATSGWRRRCLYILLLTLLAISLINLSLTLWILKIMHFNVDGMGHLHVETGGLKMQGISNFTQKMSTARIMSREEEDLSIEGYFNLTIHTADSLEDKEMVQEEEEETSNSTSQQSSTATNQPNYIHINVDDVLAGTKQFQVKDKSGKLVFRANRDGTFVGAKTFTVTGSQGANMIGSMQTPHLYAADVHELRLDSVTRDIRVQSQDNLKVEARNGDISSICSSNASLVAKRGSIRFDNPNIYFSNLTCEGEKELEELLKREQEEREPKGKRLQEMEEEDGLGKPTTSPTETQIRPPVLSRRAPDPTPPSTGMSGDGITNDSNTTDVKVEVFQVCVCPGGRLFVVPANKRCIYEDHVCR